MFNCLSPEISRLYRLAIQVAFVDNHWVTITNFYSFHPVIDSNQWFMFDSLNDANIHPVPQASIQKPQPWIQPSQSYSYELSEQIGFVDCGIFALAYATALVNDKEITNMAFKQNKNEL